MQIELGTQFKAVGEKGEVVYHPPGKQISVDKRFAEKTKRYMLRLTQVDENERKSMNLAAARIVDPEKQSAALDVAGKKESRKTAKSLSAKKA